MNAESPEEEFKQFQCRRCNECCRQSGFVYLKGGEEDRIAAFLQLEVRDFIEQYCEIQDRRHLILKKHPDEACIFLSQEGCKIHPAKPGQCRDFPVKWRTPASFDYCQGLIDLHK